jgi:predicted O-methyltransferase YrrM
VGETNARASTLRPAVGRIRDVARALALRGGVQLVTHPASALAYWRCLAGAAVDCSGYASFVGRLPRIRLRDVVPNPDDVPVTIIDHRYILGGLAIQELVVLNRLARWLDPELVFEVGTFLGATTIQLAANTTAPVYTLDLPPANAGEAAREDVFRPERPGLLIADSPYEERITQLFGDSRTFNFSPFHRRVDLVFVDADHSYDAVRADSRRAVEMLSDRGAVVWHDYAQNEPGVVRALEELGRELPLRHLRDSSLVLYGPAGSPLRAP